MTPESETKLSILYGLAGMFDYKFSDPVLDLYMACLESISAQELKRIASEGIKTNRWKFMPKPGEFFTTGEVAILDDSRDAANLVWSAIAKFGRNNPTEAQNFVGGLAWAVVERMGGWSSICEVAISEKGIFIAQFRDLTQSLSRKSEKNELEIKPSLPLPKLNLENKKRILEISAPIGTI